MAPRSANHLASARAGDPFGLRIGGRADHRRSQVRVGLLETPCGWHPVQSGGLGQLRSEPAGRSTGPVRRFRPTEHGRRRMDPSELETHGRRTVRDRRRTASAKLPTNAARKTGLDGRTFVGLPFGQRPDRPWPRHATRQGRPADRNADRTACRPIDPTGTRPDRRRDLARPGPHDRAIPALAAAAGALHADRRLQAGRRV